MFLKKCASQIHWAVFEPVWRILADSTAVARQVFSPNHLEGGCCNLHKKTFWTTQEAVGTALDSSFATECIQHSKCIQAARVLERQTAKTRGLTPVQDEKNRKIQFLNKKNQVSDVFTWNQSIRIYSRENFYHVPQRFSTQLMNEMSLQDLQF